MSRELSRRLLLMLALLAAAPLVAETVAADTLEVIPLRHRSAEEVIPILRPLLAPGGALTGTGYQLLVRTTPANLAELRQAVAAVDTAPRQLRITVGQGSGNAASSAGVSGSVAAGSDDVQVGINRPARGPTGASVQAGAGSRQDSLANTSSVQVLEGTETWIALGRSVPVATTERVPGRPGTVRRTTSYQDTSTGFYATARVNGDRVTLDISSRQQRQGQARGVVQTAGTVTTVSGRLGQWLQLGAVEESSSGSDRGLLVWGRHTGSSTYAAWVKVDPVP